MAQEKEDRESFRRSSGSISESEGESGVAGGSGRKATNSLRFNLTSPALATAGEDSARSVPTSLSRSLAAAAAVAKEVDEESKMGSGDNGASLNGEVALVKTPRNSLSDEQQQSTPQRESLSTWNPMIDGAGALEENGADNV